MASKAKQEQRLISWRREKILNLMAQGIISQRELSQMLGGISESTVSRDITFLARQCKENLKFHVEQRVPLEMEKLYIVLHNVLRQALQIVSDSDTKTSEKIAALQLVLHTCDKISSVLSDKPIINEVVDKFKIQREQLNAAANEIRSQREKVSEVE